MRWTISGLFVFLLLAGCAGTNPESNPYSNRIVAPSEVVREHLRAIEAAEWDKAMTYLSEDFKMKMKGYPLKGSRKNALQYHKALRAALPNLAFNEEVLKEGKHEVKLRVRITGNHQHTFTFPEGGRDPIPGTGKPLQLDYQTITYTIRFNQIRAIYGESLGGISPLELRQKLAPSN